MAATICGFTFRFRVEALASSTGRSQPGRESPTSMSFPRIRRLRQRDGGVAGHHVCHAGGEGSSCCGGSDGKSNGGGGGKCSSHGRSKSDVAGVGKEFEALVAQKTMQEFEEGYETGPMNGAISRDVISDVVNIYPDAAATKREETFLDIDQLLAEATSMSVSGADFIFDDSEELFV